MKYLNFHRKNVTRSEGKTQTKKRTKRNNIQSTSADKIHSFSPKRDGSAHSMKRYCAVKSALDIPTIFDHPSRPMESSSTIQRRSALEMKPTKPSRCSYSPQEKAERNAKVDKLIKENIRKEMLLQEKQRKEQREREASSLRRKNLLEQKNQHIRKLNHEKTERRRLKLKGAEEGNEMKELEEALLAVSDGVQKIKDYE